MPKTEAIEQLLKRYSGNTEAISFLHEIAVNKMSPEVLRLDAISTLINLEKLFNADRWLKLLQSKKKEIVLVILRGLQNSPDRKAALEVLQASNLQNNKEFAGDLKFTKDTLSGIVSSAKQNKRQLRSSILAKAAKGIAALGRIVYKTHLCYSCHEGKIAGQHAPILKGIAAKHDIAYLLDSILFPEKSVKTGFLRHLITLKNGQIILGELRTNIRGDFKYDQLTDAQGNKKLYLHEDIVSTKTVSAVPVGLEKTMSEGELLDLLAYLNSLNKTKKLDKKNTEP